MIAAILDTAAPHEGMLRRLSDVLVRRHNLLRPHPPRAAAAVARHGLSRHACSRFLGQVFFSIDDFSGTDRARADAHDAGGTLQASQFRHHRCARSASLPPSRCSAPSSAFRSPTTQRAMPGRTPRRLFYLAVMMPLWSSYLVKIYAWKLLLAKEGAIGWIAGRLGLGPAAGGVAGAARLSAGRRSRSAISAWCWCSSISGCRS